MDLEQLQKQIVAEIWAGKSLIQQGGLLTPLIKSALEATLEGEMEAHLNEDPAPSKNHRNAKSTKIVKHSAGSFELDTPRDCDAGFEPEIVKKRQTVLNSKLVRNGICLCITVEKQFRSLTFIT